MSSGEEDENIGEYFGRKRRNGEELVTLSPESAHHFFELLKLALELL